MYIYIHAYIYIQYSCMHVYTELCMYIIYFKGMCISESPLASSLLKPSSVLLVLRNLERPKSPADLKICTAATGGQINCHLTYRLIGGTYHI